MNDDLDPTEEADALMELEILQRRDWPLVDGSAIVPFDRLLAVADLPDEGTITDMLVRELVRARSLLRLWADGDLRIVHANGDDVLERRVILPSDDVAWVALGRSDSDYLSVLVEREDRLR